MPDTWRDLLADVDARTAAVVREFLAAINEAEAELLRERIAVALAAGRADEVVRLLTDAWEGVTRRYRATVGGQILDAVDGGGRIAEGGFRVEVGIRFDRTNPEAVRWARERAGALVTRIGDDARLAIRDLITRAFTDGVDVWKTAKRIEGLIGLLPDQATAVETYRRELEKLAASSRPVTRLTRMRKLSSKGLTPQRIDAWVEKYRLRLLRNRAVTIARTEIAAAANYGQLALWRQAVENGQLGTDERKRWMVTPDDRLCERCRPMDGQVRLLNDLFEAPDGTRVLMPPLHPNCRCVTVLQIDPVAPRATA